MAELTKRFVEAVAPQSKGHVVWDDEFPGSACVSIRHLRVTPLGRTHEGPLRALHDWTIEHRDDVLRARAECVADAERTDHKA